MSQPQEDALRTQFAALVRSVPDPLALIDMKKVDIEMQKYKSDYRKMRRFLGLDAAGE